MPHNDLNSEGQYDHQDPLPDTTLTPQELIQQLYGKGKPLLFVVIATQIAAAADEMTELMKEFISKKRPRKRVPQVPPVEAWILMYRRHNRMWNTLSDLEGFGDSNGTTGQEGAQGFRALVALPPDEREEVLKEAFTDDELREMLGLLAGYEFPPPQEVVAALVSEFDAKADRDADAMDDVIADVEMQFFFRVWVPCWILYRDYPPNLMRRARQDDLDAMDDLLRLDKSVILDPKVAEHFHRYMHGHERGPRDRLLRALNGQPRGGLDAKKVRSYFAGMISQLANSLHCPIEEPEIRELFKRIAIARGQLNDPQLTPGTDALAKAIQRNRDWPSLTPVQARTKSNQNMSR